MSDKIRLLLSLPKRLMLLLFIFILAYVLVSLLAMFVMMKFGSDSTPAMRILTVMQDVLLFILPAVATAMVVTRQPAELLAIDRLPGLTVGLLGVCTLVASIPAMNMVIWANENIPLPAELLAQLRALEDSSASMIEALMGPHTVANYVMALLIVGLFAALSEELLFRGALQRLMTTGGVNVHVAIWTAAVVFSMMHLSVFGFVPRVLLGAFFGYALLWSRSLWLPVLLHFLNNGMYLTDQFFFGGAPEGQMEMPAAWMAVVSALLTVVGLLLMRRAALRAQNGGR